MLYQRKMTIKVLMLGWGVLGLNATQAGQYTTITGETITAQDIQQAVKKITIPLEVLKHNIKNSDLDGKIGFSLVQRWMGVGMSNKYYFPLDLRINATKRSYGIDVHSLNVLGNFEKFASPDAFHAMLLHEKYHLKELHNLRNRYEDEHNRSMEISALTGAGVSALPIICSALRRTPSAPVKSAVVLGATAGLLMYKGLERRKILNRREQERGADKYMLCEGTAKTTKGALEQFACTSVFESLALASRERQLQKKVSYMPSRFISAYVAGRSNWYRESELSRDKLKRVAQSMGSDVSLETRKNLVINVLGCMSKAESVAGLAQQYQLPPQQVQRIIAMTEESCLDAVS